MVTRYQVCAAATGQKLPPARPWFDGNSTVRLPAGEIDDAARSAVSAAIDRRDRRLGEADIGRRLIIASLDRIGFAGRIFPVNPNYPSVLGHLLREHRRATRGADVAVFCLGHGGFSTPSSRRPSAASKAAVIYDGGFAEQGAEGRALQDEHRWRSAVEAGIALCGPNCMGMLNPHHPSTTYLQELRDPAGLAGNVGIVSQSGGLCVSLLTDTQPLRLQPYRLVRQRGGAERGRLSRIPRRGPAHRGRSAAFIETIREPERFVAALDRAAALGKPVVVLKVGRQRARQARRRRPIPAARPATRRPFLALLRAHRRDRGRGPRRIDRGAGGLPERATCRPGGASGSSPRRAGSPS